MPWVAVNDNGDETLFDIKPKRGKDGGGYHGADIAHYTMAQ